MKKFLIGFVILAILAGTAGYVWWSQRTVSAYSGLASQFPDSVTIYAEVRHLGQWMEVPEGEAASAGALPSSGRDPLLNVIGRVWAAEPLQPAQLPALLSSQPLAVGIWNDESDWKSCALMALEPGQRLPLEDFLKSKLGEGEVVDAVEGVELRRFADASDFNDHPVLWGVSDRWAVLCTGSEVARLVLTQPASPLDTDPVFLDAASHFPLERGGWVFVRGGLIGDAMRNACERIPLLAHGAACGVQPASQDSGTEGEPENEDPEDDSDVSSMVDNLPLDDIADAFLRSVLPAEDVQSIALWSAPPLGGSDTWEVQAWVGFSEEPSGVLRMLLGNSARRPDLAMHLPRNGSVYAWTGGEDPARLYQNMILEAEKVLPPDQMSTVRMGLGAVEGKLGLSLANDLMPCLGDESCYVWKTERRGPDEEDDIHGALFLSLRDSRRMKALLREKVAPGIGLAETEIGGFPAWHWQSEGRLSDLSDLKMVISGQNLVFTNSADWALSTAEASRAWTRLSELEGRYTAFAVVDPALWGDVGEPLVQASWISESDGVLLKARFPGNCPDISKALQAKEPADDSHDQATEASI